MFVCTQKVGTNKNWQKFKSPSKFNFSHYLFHWEKDMKYCACMNSERYLRNETISEGYLCTNTVRSINYDKIDVTVKWNKLIGKAHTRLSRH